LKKILLVFLHGLSLASLIWIGWTAYLAVQRPSIGAYWAYQYGIVYSIDAGHPSAGAFEIGDRILGGVGQSPSDLYRLGGKTNGEIIQITVERNGQAREVNVLIAPSSLEEIFGRFSAILAALGFWLAGSYVLAFSRSGRQSVLFFFLCLSAIIALTCGLISSYGPAWTKIAFHCGLLWLGFFIAQLHLIFPSPLNEPYRRNIGLVLFFINGLLCTSHLVASLTDVTLLSTSIIWPFTLLIFGIELGLTVMFVIRSYRKSNTSVERIQTGIITLSCILGAIPVVGLILIPQLILGYPLVSFNIAFLS